MIMKASQLIAIGIFSAIGSAALSNEAASPDQTNWRPFDGQPAAVAMRPIEALVAERFRGVRRATLKFVKHGERLPVFMISADVGELDAVDNLTITLDNDAPFKRGEAVWRFPLTWPIRPQADPSPSSRRFDGSEIGKPIRLPVPGISPGVANCIACAWRQHGELIVTTSLLPLIDDAWVARAPVDEPPRVEFGAREFGERNLAAVAEPPADLLLGGGIVALAAALARRRPAA
jgi:hypothetical protein